MPGMAGGHMIGIQPGVTGLPRQPNVYGMQPGVVGMQQQQQVLMGMQPPGMMALSMPYQPNMMGVQQAGMMMQSGLMGSQQNTGMSFNQL